MLHGLAEVTLAGWLQGAHTQHRGWQASCTPAALCPGLPVSAACQFTAPPLFRFAGSYPGVAEGAALELTHHRKSSGHINNQNQPFPNQSGEKHSYKP